MAEKDKESPKEEDKIIKPMIVVKPLLQNEYKPPKAKADIHYRSTPNSIPKKKK